MEYRKFGETWYVRMDKGDEIIGGILELCRRETIASAVFSGIGGCSAAEIQTFLPETGAFETQTLRITETPKSRSPSLHHAFAKSCRRRPAGARSPPCTTR